MKKKVLVLLMTVMVAGGVFVGCGGSDDKGDKTGTEQEQQIKEINPEEVVKKITEAVELRAMGPVDETLAKEVFKLNLDNIEAYSIQKGQMNTGLETIAVIKAKEGKVEDVKASLEAYKETINPFYPGEEEAVKGAKLIEKGNYVGFFLIPDYEEGQGNVDKVVEIFENSFK